MAVYYFLKEINLCYSHPITEKLLNGYCKRNKNEVNSLMYLQLYYTVLPSTVPPQQPRIRRSPYCVGHQRRPTPTPEEKIRT